MSHKKKQRTPGAIHCQHTRLVPLGELKPNPRNPNTHPAEQIDLLAKVIKAQGWRQPITVSKRSGFIVRGHGRLLAAQKLELEVVPVDEQAYETDAEEWADLIADNRLAELAEMDNAALKDLVEELDTGEIDLDLTGYDDDALASLMTQFHADTGADGLTDDDATPEEVEPRTKPGDVWQLGGHRLLCGDSTDRKTVADFVGKNKAAIVFTDPPYGVNVKGGKQKKNIAGDLTQAALPFSFEIAVEIASDTKAKFYFCGGEGNLGLYAKLFDRYLAALPKHILWVKNGFVMKPNGYHCQYELIFHGYKAGGGGRDMWYAGRTMEEASDVWQIKRDPGREYRHPTQKPVALPLRALRNHSKKGDVVYEPFSGSGSTMIACERLGRVCLALELDPYFCDVTVQRWEEFTGKKAKRVKCGK